MADAIKVKDRDGNVTYLSPEYLEKFPDEGFTPVDPADDPYAGLVVSGPIPQTIVDGAKPEATPTPDSESKSKATTKKGDS